MANVVIYYQLEKGEETTFAVNKVTNIIKRLEKKHTIYGVFLEEYDNSFQFYELLEISLSKIDYVYLNKPLKNEFDLDILNQLSKNEKFEIISINF